MCDDKSGMGSLTWQVMLGWRGTSFFRLFCGWRQRTLRAADSEGWMRIPGILYGLYLIFFARWRPESTASIKWPISFLAAHLSICLPLCLILLSAAFLYVFFVIFNPVRVSFLYQSGCGCWNYNPFFKGCIKSKKEVSILGFFPDNTVDSLLITASFLWIDKVAFAASYIFNRPQLSAQMRHRDILISFW